MNKKTSEHLSIEEKLRGTFDESPIAISYYDISGELIDANRAYLNLFGVVGSLEQLQGFKIFEFPSIPANAKEQLLRGEIVNYEAEFDFEKAKKQWLYETTKSGVIYIHIMITPLGLREKNTLAGYLVYMLEITEERKSEEALRRSDNHFQSLIDDSMVGYGIIQDNRVIYLNDAWVKIGGYEKEEIETWTARDLLEAVHPDDKEFVADQLMKKQAGTEDGIVPASAHRIITKNGKIHWVELFTKTIIYNGKPADFLTVLDITDRKKFEKNLKKRMNETELFLNIITHDLNNYLQTSKGYHELILEHLSSFPDLARIFQHSLTSITSATTLLSNISVLMKATSPVSYDLKPTDVLLTIIKVHKTLLELFPNKQIELQTENIMPSDSVLADMLFDQLMLNLLTNAVKSDEQESVKIKIAARDSRDSKHYTLAITDQGKGIPPEQREGIFEKFTEFQKKEKGSGLGLFIAKTLIERYNGRIWIENRVPADYRLGTTIVMKLKLA